MLQWNGRWRIRLSHKLANSGLACFGLACFGLACFGVTLLGGCASPIQEACTDSPSLGSVVIQAGTPLLRQMLSSSDAKAARCLMLSTPPERALELAARLRVGIGLPKRPGVALKVYQALSVSKGGTTAVYSPGINGAPGSVIMVNLGPVVPGNPVAMRELGIMLIGGEVGKPDLKEGWRWIKAAAAAGDAPAPAKLADLQKL